MNRTDASGWLWEQAGLIAAALAGAILAAIRPVILAPPSDEIRYLLIGLVFAAIGANTLVPARYRRATNILCGVMTGIATVLAVQMDSIGGNALGIFALIYGAAMAKRARFGLTAGETAAFAALENDLQESARGLAHAARRGSGNGWQFETATHGNQRTLKFLEDIIQEVKLPLNTVLGFAEILQSPAARDLSENERQTYHQLLLDGCRQLTAFIADAGDMARIDANHFQLLEQEADAAELTEIAMKSCRVAVDESDATVIVNVIENVELHCDVSSIHRVLVTLVTRAAKLGRAGGKIEVCFVRRPDGGLEISVVDQGPPLPPDEIVTAFEPSLHSRGMEGLSLPVARRIARLHRGNLTIEASNTGSMIARLTLPASRVTWKSNTEVEAFRAA